MPYGAGPPLPYRQPPPPPNKPSSRTHSTVFGGDSAAAQRRPDVFRTEAWASRREYEQSKARFVDHLASPRVATRRPDPADPAGLAPFSPKVARTPPAVVRQQRPHQPQPTGSPEKSTHVVGGGWGGHVGSTAAAAAPPRPPPGKAEYMAAARIHANVHAPSRPAAGSAAGASHDPLPQRRAASPDRRWPMRQPAQPPSLGHAALGGCAAVAGSPQHR